MRRRVGRAAETAAQAGASYIAPSLWRIAFI